MNQQSPFNILLADDDQDDCLFFKDALDELPVSTHLTTVHDGDQLMQYLSEITNDFPHALFLDLNMPRKNGYRCLIEIKNNAKFKWLPVIIYSTSYSKEMADILYQEGANYYLCKPGDFADLRAAIYRTLTLLAQGDPRPAKENFLISQFKK
jgi:CheY-like chemotaxis protein